MAQSTAFEPFPQAIPLTDLIKSNNNDTTNASNLPKRRRRSSGLPADPQGDTSVPALATIDGAPGLFSATPPVVSSRVKFEQRSPCDNHSQPSQSCKTCKRKADMHPTPAQEHPRPQATKSKITLQAMGALLPPPHLGQPAHPLPGRPLPLRPQPDSLKSNAPRALHLIPHGTVPNPWQHGA